MTIEAPRPMRLRLLRAAICVAGLAALSMAASAADRPERNRCEPITKACNNPLIIPRQTAAPAKPTSAATTTPTKRNRCEPITKVCIYKSDAGTDAPATAAQEKKEPSVKSKRQRCEPPTKVCIYR